MTEITISINDTTALVATNALRAIVESPFVAIDTRDREALAELADRLQDWRVKRLEPDRPATAPAPQWSKEVHDVWVARYRWCRAHHVPFNQYPHAH